MIKLLTVTIFAGLTLACTNAGSPILQNANSAAVKNSNEKSQTAIAHSLENQTPPANSPTGEKTKWKQSGDPIDTKEFDTAIAAAEVALKKAPGDDALKRRLGDAYFKRGMALTDPARQYASALGDFRRAVKYDPANTTAKGWIDQIIMIYDSMNKEYPKEGEEPPPLPFTKGK
jgi:tetratricopeptide (TPR) repeat protein